MSDQIEHSISQKWILKNTFWIYAAALLTAPMQYILRIVVAHNLPLEQVWLYYSLLGLTGILAIYNDLGFKEAVGYFYPKYLADKDYNKSKTLLWFTLGFQLVTSCILAGVLYYFAQWIALHYLDDPTSALIVQVFGIYLVCFILYNFIDWLFLVFQDGFWNKLLGLINYVILITAVCLVPYGLFSFLGVRSNLTGFVLAQIVAAILTIGISAIVFFRKYKKLAFQWTLQRDRSEYKKIQLYSLGVLFTNNLIFLIGQIDLQFTTFLFGTKEAGLYSYGMMVTNLLITLLSPIGALLYPLISHLKARKHHATLEMILHGVINYLWVIALVWSLFLFMYSNQITSFLFGQAYREAGSIVKRNLPFVFFGLISGLLFMVYAGLGLIKQRIKVLIWAFVANVVLNLILSQILGVYGIALTVGLTWFILFLFSYFDLKKSWVYLQFDYLLLGKNLLVWIGWLLLLHYLLPIDMSTKLSSGTWLAISWILYAIFIAFINIPIFKKSIALGKMLIAKPSDIVKN